MLRLVGRKRRRSFFASGDQRTLESFFRQFGPGKKMGSAVDVLKQPPARFRLIAVAANREPQK